VLVLASTYVYWIDKQGERKTSHTLDPDKTIQNIQELGGRVVGTEQEVESKGRPDTYTTPEGTPKPQPEPAPKDVKEQTVFVTWEQPIYEDGKLIRYEYKTVQTTNLELENVQNQIQARNGSVTRVVSGEYADTPSPAQTNPVTGETISPETKGKILYEKEPSLTPAQEYQETKQVPTSVQEQVSAPEDLRRIGVKETDYERIVYEESIGVISSEEANRRLSNLVQRELQTGPEGPDIEYIKKHSTFGNGFSWEQYKQREPAAELKRSESGNIEVSMNYVKWNKEQWQNMSEAERFGKAFGASVLFGFASPEFWIEQATTGKGSEVIARREYEAQQRGKENIGAFALYDVLLSDPVTNIILPAVTAGAGSALASGAAKVGTGAIAVTGRGAGAVAKAIPIFAKGAAVTMAGTYAVGEGVRIGTAFAKDTKSGLIASSEYGMRLTSAMAGGMAMQKYLSTRAGPIKGLKVTEAKGKGTYDYAMRKYVEIGGKQIGYGKAVRFQTLEPMAVEAAPTGLPYTTGATKSVVPFKTPTVKPSAQPIISISQVRGTTKITYSPITGKYIKTKITPIVSRPTTPTTVKPIVDYGKGLEVDLFRRAEGKTIQKTIQDFNKGKYLIVPKKTVTGKPIIKETIPLEADIKSPTKIYTLKDIVQGKPIKETIIKPVDKTSLKQTKLLDQQVSRMFDMELRPIKPYKPVGKKPMGVEEYYKVERELAMKEFLRPRAKPIVTKQTRLDKLFKPDASIIKVAVYEPKGITPLKFSKPKQPDIFKPAKPSDMKPITVTVEKAKPITEPKTAYEDFYKQTSKASMEPYIKQRTKFRTRTFTEEEYISSFWKDTAPKTPSVTKAMFVVVSSITKTVPKIETIIDLKPATIQDTKLDIFSTQANIQDIYNMQAQRDLQKLSPAQITATIIRTDQDVLPKTKVDVLNNQMNLMLQKTVLDTKQIPITKFDKAFDTKIKTPLIPNTKVYETLGINPPNQAYDAWVKKRQYKDGKRIRGTVWVKVNKKPLYRNDAINVASGIVDNTAKASFKVTKAKGKPVKRKTKKYNANEYNQRGNYFVELPEFRIDSKGELREITQRGIAANRRKGPTLGTDYKRVINTKMPNINIDRRIKKMLGVK